MACIRRIRQNSVCCFSLKTGCRLLVLLEFFLPPIYVYAAGYLIDELPYFLVTIFPVFYLALLSLYCGTLQKCCCHSGFIIMSMIIRIFVILAICGWTLYEFGVAIGEEETNQILVHILAFFVEKGVGTYTWICAWSYYLELTETPVDNRRVINIQVTV